MIRGDRAENEALIRALAWHALERTGAFDASVHDRQADAIPLVYVDKNPWGRHRDDPTVHRNLAEAEAFAELLERLRSGSVRLVYSSISFGEAPAKGSVVPASRDALHGVIGLRLAGLPVLAHGQAADTDLVAEFLYAHRRIRGMDAIHGAAALLEGAWYFVTGDDRLRRKLRTLYDDWSLPASAVTPVEVVAELQRGALIHD